MSNSQYKNNSSDGVFEFVAFIFVIAIIFYTQQKTIYEFAIFISDRLYTGLYFVKYNLSMDTTQTVKTLILINQKAKYYEPSLSNIVHIYSIIGSLFNYIVIFILLLWLAFSNYLYKYEKKFRTTHDYASLKNEYYKINPKLRVIQHIPNFAKDDEKGAFSRIETEWQFAVKHKIINGALSSRNDTRESFNEDNYLKTVYSQCGPLHPHPMVIDNKVQIKGAAKVILAIFCFYHEHEFKKTKHYINESSSWFVGTRHSSKNYQYQFTIPKHENKILDNIIIQAFTNSSTLDAHDKIRRKDANEPMVNSVIRKSLYIHNFTYSLLMSLFSSIKMVSTSDFKWLKAIDRNLYYALNNVGDPSPHPRCLGSAFIYEQEKLLFKQRRPLIKKKLKELFELSRQDIVTLFDWDINMNDFYFALESRQWVHHSKYLDVEDEDLINLKEKEFSYDNKVHLLLLSKKDGRNKYITRSIHFRKTDGTKFIESMRLNQAGMLDTKDIAKFSIVVNSNYLIVNDYNALKKLCYTNRQYLPKIIIRGYDALADACEVLGIKSYTWHNIIAKYKASYEKADNLETSLSDSEYNWFIFSHISNEIKTLYSLS